MVKWIKMVDFSTNQNAAKFELSIQALVLITVFIFRGGDSLVYFSMLYRNQREDIVNRSSAHTY